MEVCTFHEKMHILHTVFCCYNLNLFKFDIKIKIPFRAFKDFSWRPLIEETRSGQEDTSSLATVFAASIIYLPEIYISRLLLVKFAYAIFETTMGNFALYTVTKPPKHQTSHANPVSRQSRPVHRVHFTLCVQKLQ